MYTNSQPQLYVGSQGDAVRQAQCELNFAYAYGHSTNYGNGSYNGLTVDGDFGQTTEAAVKNFQIRCMSAWCLMRSPSGGGGMNRSSSHCCGLPSACP
ncbi:peptidoglycan-binding domain-containing protein [Catenulispora rubra]|uniref:peptidoglycan-binding domain-containing protein n=1 Tax=Catenulispora rubra TaxID=280293 RepID=UPI0034DCC54B